MIAIGFEAVRNPEEEMKKFRISEAVGSSLYGVFCCT
jgi:hypothetical protein